MVTLLLLMELKLAKKQALNDNKSDSDLNSRSLQEDNFGGLF
mgnify:FL=1